jgi:amylosucrase
MGRVPTLLDAALDLAATELAGVPEYRRDTFALRLQRWWADLIDGLDAVYGEAAPDLALRLVRLMAAAHRTRPADLARLDELRTLTPQWLSAPQMLGYAAYAERLTGDREHPGTLVGVADRIPYLKELGVTYLHLMPLLRPRPGDSDGGYAVADYRTVRPDLGTVADLSALAAELRANGISLVLDLVLNHVAREHEWAVAARAGSEKYRAYFMVYPDRAEPDAYEATLPEVFPDFAPGSFTWDADLSGWVWTTFNSWQWDVNWANPDVFAEYADIVLFLANAGVEVVRLDAIAFVWKRLGTNSQNQPEVHSITQALRAVARIACPAVAFKAEAIVGPADLVQYLGRGTHHGKVSDLAYHNSLMVQVWSMLAARDVTLAAHALRALPPIPASAAWVTYVRGHDDIGWAIDDADAAAVGLSGSGHRWFLSEWYSGLFPGSTAHGLVFQENPATGDRRISGTAAALAGIDAARDGSDPTALDVAVARLLLAYSIVAGWGGVPVVWSGDELAARNDADWATEPGHSTDNRWVHRPRLDPDRAALRTLGGTVESRMFAGIAHLAAVRARLPHLHASVAAEVLDVNDPGVLPVLRRHPLGNFLGLYNVTADWRPFPGRRLRELALDMGTDALSGTRVVISGDDNVWLSPYAALWITASAPA